MGAPPPPPSPTKTLGQFIDDQIAKLIYTKGNIDGILYNMRPDNPNRGIYSWIQSIIYDMLGMCEAIKIDYEGTSKKIFEHERLMRLILDADPYAPREDLVERAQKLGSFYRELIKRGKGQT